MDRALYVAMTGATKSLQAQAANAHNLANISTHGFRQDLESSASFQIDGGVLPTRVNAALEHRGWDPTPGGLETTDRDLDIALRGNGWMAVLAPDGTEAYTRNGSLRMTPEGQLVSGSGHPVLGDAGPIAIPPASQLTIGKDGTISVVPRGAESNALAVVGRIRVVEGDPKSLERGADGLMRAVPGADLPPVAGEALISGALESSNVNAAQAMVNMIELARQFEMQLKVISTAEENAQLSATVSRMR